jgi:hypothetical protein
MQAEGGEAQAFENILQVAGQIDAADDDVADGPVFHQVEQEIVEEEDPDPPLEGEISESDVDLDLPQGEEMSAEDAAVVRHAMISGADAYHNFLREAVQRADGNRNQNQNQAGGQSVEHLYGAVGDAQGPGLKNKGTVSKH